MGNVPLMRALSTSSINWTWPQHALDVWLCRFLIRCCRRCAISGNLCSNKKRSPLCLQRFQLIPADCALQRPQGTDFQTAASRSRSTGLSNVTASSSAVFLRWVRPRPRWRFISRLDWFSPCNIVQVLRVYLCRRNHQPDASWEALGF